MCENMGLMSPNSNLGISEDEVDSDVAFEEIPKTMFKSANLITERALGKSYVLHVTGTLEAQPTLLAALSDYTVHVLKYDNEELYEDAILSEHKDVIVGVKFSAENKQNIFTASNDGVIKLWDLRVPQKCVSQFIDTSREEQKKAKRFSSFDVSPNSRLLVCGSELYEGDAFLLFWDARSTELLGGYWESHTDDITEVKFHPEDSNKLISGSTDGLINLFDLSQTCEDDALIETFNTESSVSTLTWYSVNRSDAIACTTHTNDLQLRNTEEAEPYANFSRADISVAIKQRHSEWDAYLAQVHDYNSGLLIVAGSVHGDGQTLFTENRSLRPAFDLDGNKQIIRSSWCNPHAHLLATGGENGVVNVWMLKEKI